MTPIPLIIEKRMTDVFHVHTYLVGTARLQPAFDPGDITEPFQHGIVCDGMFPLVTLREYGHLHPVFGVTADVSLNGSLIFRDDSPYQRPVFPFGGLVEELETEVAFGLRTFGNHQQTGRILVDTVYQSQSGIGRIVLGIIPQVPGQCIQQRTGVIAMSRMHNQAGRLVDNQQVFISSGMISISRLGRSMTMETTSNGFTR